MTFLEELTYRGLVKDCTDIKGLVEKLKEPTTLYCGFDPTADSLHVGHLQQILLLKRYQLQGHRPVALCGGATGMIGDPRPTLERKMLSLEELNHNVECIKDQLSRFLDFGGEGGAILVNNFDWLSKINILDFLREYGKHFNVNYMINKDVVASRLASGISFTEFSYTILQAADWLHLYQNYHCEMQIGGSDQWGNLTSGSELIRKVEGSDAKVFGITSPLITKADGSKFGKSEGGNVWLNPAMTSPFQFYQFFLNTSDDDVIDYLKRLTLLTPTEIDALAILVQQDPGKREAQKKLAEETTRLVHAQEGLEEAMLITSTLFQGDFDKLSIKQLKEALSGAPHNSVNEDMLLVDLLVDHQICSSKREARELIKGNSIQLNGIKVTELDTIVKKELAYGNELSVIKKGKKNYFVVLHLNAEILDENEIV